MAQPYGGTARESSRTDEQELRGSKRRRREQRCRALPGAGQLGWPVLRGRIEERTVLVGNSGTDRSGQAWQLDGGLAILRQAWSEMECQGRQRRTAVIPERLLPSRQPWPARDAIGWWVERPGYQAG